MDITTTLLIVACIFGAAITVALMLHFTKERCKNCRGDLLRHQPTERTCIRCGRTEVQTVDTTGETGVRGRVYWRMTKPGRAAK